MKVLWLIAARSGSKSIPDKNIKLLGEKPLMQYRIETARKTKYNTDIWLSTDSEKYAEIGKLCGAHIPFIRPIELALDNSSSSDVVIHAMEYANDNSITFDFIGLLEPTSPFVSENELNCAIEMLQRDKEAHSIVAVKHARPSTFFIQEESEYLEELSNRFMNTDKLNRQNFKKEITPSGGFYISRWGSFMKYKTFYTPKTIPFLLNGFSSIEIDEDLDWYFAEFILTKYFNEL